MQFRRLNDCRTRNPSQCFQCRMHLAPQATQCHLNNRHRRLSYILIEFMIASGTFGYPWFFGASVGWTIVELCGWLCTLGQIYPKGPITSYSNDKGGQTSCHSVRFRLLSYVYCRLLFYLTLIGCFNFFRLDGWIRWMGGELGHTVSIATARASCRRRRAVIIIP